MDPKKFLSLIVMVIMVGGGSALFFNRDRIENVNDVAKVLNPTQPKTEIPAAPVSLQRNAETLRIASFNIQDFGVRKMQDPVIIATLAKIIRNFDIVAIQEISSVNVNIMPEFVALLNADGSKFDYVMSERLGRTDQKEQYAFVFDTNSVEVDRNNLYTVFDHDDLLEREPFFAWFRAKGPSPNEAFTFTLVNIHTSPKNAQAEVNCLDDVMSAIANDGRGEDDIILLGDLNSGEREMGDLGSAAFSWVIHDKQTMTVTQKQYDNIVFFKAATDEYTGIGDVFDFLSEYNLDRTTALAVSDHMPVWGEFSRYEGGRSRVARIPSSTRR